MTRTTGAKDLSEVNQGIIIGLHLTESSTRVIVNRLNRSRSCIQGFIDRYRLNPNGPEHETRGRKRLTDERTNRHIVMAVKRNRFATTNEIKDSVEGAG